MIELQCTLFSKSGKYRPVSTIVKVEDAAYYSTHKQTVQKTAIERICRKRYWTKQDLIKFEYTTFKVRVYDKEKIERENKERYEKIKEERGWK